MTLRIVTDSTCDLPQEIVRSLSITVVPCNVHFGTEVYEDGVDIEAAEFYRRLQTGSVYPTTSQPSVGAFVGAYQRLGKEAEQVLSLHISSKLSVTHNSAVLAKDEVKEGPEIEVFDSQQVSLGLGLMVVEVARIARDGGSLAEALEFLRRESRNFVAYCSVDTLEYLVRGGRASRLQGFFGSLLDIKPILLVRDGETHPVDRVRTRKKVLQKLEEIVAAQGNLRALGLLHSVCQDEADALADGCSPYFPRESMVISEFSSVMGVHLGPRALGVALWAQG